MIPCLECTLGDAITERDDLRAELEAAKVERDRLYRLFDLCGAQNWGLDNLAKLDAMQAEHVVLRRKLAECEKENALLKVEVAILKL